MVAPEEKTVQVYILSNNQYVTKTYDETSDVPVTVLPGCVIALPLVFGV
jgi:hypothetical protein